MSEEEMGRMSHCAVHTIKFCMQREKRCMALFAHNAA